MVVQVFRHGDRSPIRRFPTDQYHESDWPQGYGQLSIVSMYLPLDCLSHAVLTIRPWITLHIAVVRHAHTHTHSHKERDAATSATWRSIPISVCDRDIPKLPKPQLHTGAGNPPHTQIP